MQKIIESESKQIANMRMHLESILNCTLEYSTTTLELTLNMSCYQCITSLYLVLTLINNVTLYLKRKNKGLRGRECRQRVVVV